MKTSFIISSILVVLVAILVYYSRNHLRRFFFVKHHSTLPVPNWERDWQSPRVFSKEELAGNDGRNGANSYLTVLGEIYDVTGSKHYSEGSGYHVFIGQDASLAFVSGNFGNAATDDVSVLDTSQIKGIEKWVIFYRLVPKSDRCNK